MTTNDLIVKAAVAAANGRVPGLPTQGGWCLKAVRLIVEWGLFDGRQEFYKRWLVAGTTTRGGTDKDRLLEARADPWASDIESSMKRLGLGVPAALRKPGDLVFNYRAAAPIGHVGVLLTRDMVLENIRPDYRPSSVHLAHGSLSITPYAALPLTLVARLRA